MESSRLEHSKLVHLVGSKWITNSPQILIPSPLEQPPHTQEAWVLTVLQLGVAWSTHSTVLYKCYHFLCCYDMKKLQCCSILPSSPTGLLIRFIGFSMQCKICGKSYIYIGLHTSSFSAYFYGGSLMSVSHNGMEWYLTRNQNWQCQNHVL